MPVERYQGKTFVAFMDIAGFKGMMSDGKRAPKALDAFYSTGYHVLHDQNCNGPKVDGFFISDCGILFVRQDNNDDAIRRRLDALCRIVQQIHRRTFEKAVQLTTSIAWGDFSYDERIEFPGIEKNPIFGNAYVAAFKDNEGVTPKLYPSECRIIKDGLPEEIKGYFNHEIGGLAGKMRATDEHYYYEWMRVDEV